MTAPDRAPTPAECDLLVVGSGAGGLSTAIVAKKLGLDVVVVEKAEVFGGTTAFSGGVLWIPRSPHATRAGIRDEREAVLRYLRAEAGAHYDAASAEAFVDRAPEMVEFFERETAVKFIASLYPDYHPTADGGVDIGRSITAAPFDIRALGRDMPRLRRPLATLTFVGMMFNSSSADLKHFFNATRSLASAIYVVRRLLAHAWEVLRHGRGVQATVGNALAARLAKSTLDLKIPILTSTPVEQLVVEGGRVVGAQVRTDGRVATIRARRAVVLAAGGFAHDLERIGRAYVHVRRGGEHFSPVPAGNTGDGARLAESVGGEVPIHYPHAAAWMPTSKVPMKDGTVVAFPHLLDRYKPGVIGVLKSGKRFTNESNSYHDVGAAMIEACAGEAETAMWLVCDQATIARYGLGYVKPAPIPLGRFLKNGYLFRGATLAELARAAGIDAAGLEATVRRFNEGAVRGEDPEFGRGGTSFNRYLGDPAHAPNPCVAPVAKGPFYAVKVVMGDLGSFDGIRTDAAGRVLAAGEPVPGLYAVGNDRASMMGGAYPGAGITLGPAMTFGYLTARHAAGLEPDLAAASPERRGVDAVAA